MLVPCPTERAPVLALKLHDGAASAQSTLQPLGMVTCQRLHATSHRFSRSRMPAGLTLPLTCAVLTSFQVSAAQSGDSTRTSAHATAREIRAARVETAIAVDGRLDEPAWAAAEAAAGFTQTDPAEGQPATEHTEVRILIGGDAL